MRRSRIAALVLAVLFAGMAATAGCSSNGSPDGHTTSRPATPPGSPAAALPLGTQLGQLLKGAHYPAGWKPATAVAHNEIDSGSTLSPGFGPPRKGYVCPAVDSAASALNFTTWWGRSYASIVLQYPGQALSTPQVNLTLGAYSPGNAAKTIAQVAALASRCRSFRDQYMSHSRATASTRVIPHLGDQNLFLTSVNDTPNGKLTGQVLLVRSGSYLVGVETTTGTDGHVRPATVQGFAGWLLQLLHSKYG